MADVRLMARIPEDLHAEIEKYAQGNSTRPKSSLNATMIFLLRKGLQKVREEQQKDDTPGKARPMAYAA